VINEVNQQGGDITLRHLLQLMGNVPKFEAPNRCKCTKHGRDPIVSRPQLIDRGPGWINPGRDTIGSLPCFYVFSSFSGIDLEEFLMSWS